MSLQRYWACIEQTDNTGAQTEAFNVKETITFDPLGNFHPSLVWVECTGAVGQDWTYNALTCVFTSPDGTQTVNMPLTQAARIAELEQANAMLLLQVATLMGGAQ